MNMIAINISASNDWQSHIYDGPSALSPHLLSSNHTGLYQATSFHCSIYTVIPTISSGRPKLFAEFHAKRRGSWKHKSVAQNGTLKLAFGSAHFYGNFYELKVTCGSSLFLNISIHTVIPTGLLSADCRFSGISFYNNDQGTFFEDSTFCGTQWLTDKAWKFKNVFSSSNSLFAVFY